MDGYAKHHPLTLTVRADMLESVSGLTDNDLHKEIAFGVSTLDVNDPESLRWLACLCERRVFDLENS